MNKRSKKSTIRKKRSTRLFLLTVLIVTVILAVAGLTVVSRSLATANGTSQTTKSRENFIKVKVAGQEVEVDSQTGKLRQLTPDESQRLAEGLKRMINKSSEGLEEVQHADGSVSMNLQGRFQNVTVVRVNDEGVTQSCVDNPQAAGAFFGIDPKLIEQSDKKAASPSTPNVIAKQR
jgi:hypothetical protein